MSLCEVRIPAEPECWDSCGTCRASHLSVVERLVETGATVTLYQPLLVVEAYKTEMEISSPANGRVAEWLVEVGDTVEPGELVALITSAR